MKKYLAIACFFFFGVGSALASTVLDFDSLDGNGVLLTKQSPNYGGFVWDNNFAVVNDTLFNLYGNSYGSTSGENAVYNAYGATKEISMSNGAGFDFEGANFAGWTYKDAAYDFTSTFITLTGYNGSNVVSTMMVNLLSNTVGYSWVNVGFKGITKLEITASGDKKWWLMDDFTYSPTVPVQTVPIPASIWLLGSSILSLFGFSYRKSIRGC